MERLPTEILNQVFIQLDLAERMKCMLVCRKWWRVLDEYCLLYNVTINDNSEKFTRFITMIKSSPHRATQVQELSIIRSIFPDFNKRELCNLFPEARVIKLEWEGLDMDLQDDFIPFTEPIAMVHSNSKIKVLTDYLHCELASQMLTSSLCSNLRELSLDLYTFSASKRVILSHLKNLPHLESLTLMGLKLGVEDLEMIHTNIPSIQELYLDISLETNSEMPSNIVPAIALRKLFFYIVDGNDTSVHSQFYQYMTAKYVNVTNIDYNDYALTEVHSENLEQIYQNGALDFLRMLAQKHNKLTICHTPDNLDVFAELDAVNAEIEEFKIVGYNNKELFYYLDRSNQSKFVRKLDIRDSEFEFEFGDSIKTMTSLNTINISMDYEGGIPTLSLADCLNAFPESVTKFSTSGYIMRANRFRTQQSQIEILDISCRKLDQSLAQIVSSCFPKLKELTLSGSLEQNIDIILNYPHLKSVRITTVGDDKHAFLFACGVRTEYYVHDRIQGWKKVEVRSVTVGEVKYHSMLSITTFEDRKLNFSNRAIEIRSK